MSRGAGGPDRVERGMRIWYGLLGRHQAAVAIVLVRGAILFSFASRGVHWEADILSLISGDSAEVAGVREAAQQGMGNQMRLSVSMGDKADGPTLRDAVAALGKQLDATGEFATVWTGTPDAQVMAAGAQVAAQAPLLLTPEDLATLQSRLTPSYIQQRMAQVVAQLADPDGELLANQFRADPLDARGLLGARLKGLSPAEGATMEDGLLPPTAPTPWWCWSPKSPPRIPPAPRGCSQRCSRRLA